MPKLNLTDIQRRERRNYARREELSYMLLNQLCNIRQKLLNTGLTLDQANERVQATIWKFYDRKEPSNGTV